MKKILYSLVFSIPFLVSCSQDQKFNDSINWESFITQQDMILDQLPVKWEESSFTGNGTLGSMIYFPEDSNYLRLDIGNSRVQQYPETSGLQPQHPRLPIGYFTIHPKGKIMGGGVRLSLWDGETTGQIKTDDGEIQFASYTHALEPLIVLEVKKITGDEDCTIKWNPLPHDNPRYTYGRSVKDFKPNPAGKLDTINSVAVYSQPLHSGGGAATAWKVTQSDKGKTLFVTISYGDKIVQVADTATKKINEFLQHNLDELNYAHQEWWHNFYQHSFVSLPDKKMEKFYWMQLYKYGSITRADGALIDNQGPWLQETPWPGSWWNLNVQLNYWLGNPTNHTDLNYSLINTLNDNVDVLINNVPEEYRHNSAGVGRATGQVPYAPVGIPWKTKDQGGEVPEIGLLPWTCHNLWLHYRHTMDKDMLKDKLFPILKKSINYYIHFLEKDSLGIYHLPYTYSPEYKPYIKDANFDLSLIKWGCQTLIETSELLGIADPLIPTWKDIDQHLVPFPQDDTGFMMGADEPYSHSHRHYSHLLMIYPLYLVNADQPGSKALIEKSIQHWHSLPSQLRGYSYTGASSMYAAINQGDSALLYLEKLFGKFLLPNTLYKEAGPVMETPLSGAVAIIDMLMQSWGGKIRIFPAIPTSWKDITFHELLAEGAFEVSGSMKGGEIEFVKIKSLAGEPCILKLNIDKPIKIQSEREIPYEWINDDELQLFINKNEEAIIFTQ